MVPLLAAVVLAASPPPPAVLWSGDSGGLSVQWTAETLEARKGGKLTFRENVDYSGWPRSCEVGEWITIHSLVGTYLSTLHEESADCAEAGGHPGCATPFKTRDLLSGRLVPIEELFPKAEVLAALRDDPYLRGLFEADPEPLRTLELEPLRQYLLMKLGLVMDPSAYWFHHLERGKVAVRIGLRPAAHAGCGNTEELGLLLKIPPPLATPLGEAATGKGGFLKRNRPPRHSYRQWNGVDLRALVPASP